MKTFILLLVLLNIQIISAHADVVVRMNFQYDGLRKNVDVRLFEQSTPLTVTNFLKYVNGTTIGGGNYNDSIIHRSVAGFIVQGGGFNFDTVLNSYPAGIQPITKDNPITNEFSLSNTRGTIAMAKTGGDPDSATNQWFFNLADNSSNLDNQNGGFTVFGKVIPGNSMSIIDDIASTPVFNKTSDNPAFDSFPLINYSEPNSISSNNLIILKSVTEQFSISENIDFGIIQTGSIALSIVTIKNTGTGDLVIGNIASTNQLTTPFSITGDTCSNTTLAVSASCNITVKYSTLLEGRVSDSFNIEFTSLNTSLTHSVTGTALVDVTAPHITSTEANIDYGVVSLYDPAIDGFGHYNVIHINNEGASDLNISSVTLNGTTDFLLYDNCTLATPIAPGSSCLLPVYFKPSTLGPVTASLTIISDDPNDGSLTIPFSGLVDIDTDRVPEYVENMAPNNGDGNIDGVFDSEQSNVSSLLDINSSYITLVTESNSHITTIKTLATNNPVNEPTGIIFPFGKFDLSVTLAASANTLNVGYILPADMIPNTYYMYGPTVEDANPHWYEFMYDAATGTGATILGNVQFTSPVDGSQITRSILKIALKDGARGDSDLFVNGVITNQGGPATKPVSSESKSGSISAFMSVIMLAIMLLRIRFCL